jgi:hypothetical protein
MLNVNPHKPIFGWMLILNAIKSLMCSHHKGMWANFAYFGAVNLFHHYHERTFLEYKKWRVKWQLHAKMRGSSPQCVVFHLPNIATLCRGTHFSTCTDVVWSWRPKLPALNEVLSPVLPPTAWVSMFYFMESATIIIFFARLVHFPREWWKRWTAP